MRDAKYSATVKVIQYDDARTEITKFLTDPKRTTPNFTAARERIAAMIEKGVTPTRGDILNRSSEALNRAEDMYKQAGLGKLDLSPFAISKPWIEIEGVKVSVSCAALVKGKTKSGEDAIGCMSLFFAKQEAMGVKVRKDRCRTAAIINFEFATKHLKHLGYPLPQLCMAYDVMDGIVLKAPNSYPQKLQAMRIACKEVRLGWDEIDPPADL